MLLQSSTLLILKVSFIWLHFSSIMYCNQNISYLGFFISWNGNYFTLSSAFFATFKNFSQFPNEEYNLQERGLHEKKNNKKTSDTRIIGMTGFVWAREGWCPAEGVGWRQDCYIPFEAVSQVENWEKSFRWYFLLFGFVRPPRMLFPLRHLYPYPPPPPALNKSPFILDLMVFCLYTQI